MGCDCAYQAFQCQVCYFNPRSPNGLRQPVPRTGAAGKEFQSTQPEWAATTFKSKRRRRRTISIHAARMGCDARLQSRKRAQQSFQSTQPEWAATVVLDAKAAKAYISIHAARMGCDTAGATTAACSTSISIHAARMGCDIFCVKMNIITRYFNPRSPNGLRLAIVSPVYPVSAYFNPRSPNGLRPPGNRVWY